LLLGASVLIGVDIYILAAYAFDLLDCNDLCYWEDMLFYIVEGVLIIKPSTNSVCYFYFTDSLTFISLKFRM